MIPLQCKLGRTAVGWSANDLAEAAGVSANTVLRFEGGADVRFSTVNAMREALERKGVQFIGPEQNSPTGGPGIRFSADGVQA